MNVNIYKVTCLTNLHVGSGDINYSVVDNEVMKDEILGTPIIPASGIKGCLSKYCRNLEGKSIDGKCKLNEADNDKIFGKAQTAEENNRGQVKFLNAELFARPMRVTDGNGSFRLVTSDKLIDRFNSLTTGLGILKNNILVKENEVIAKSLEIENIVINYVSIERAGEEICIMNHEEFENIDLPVTARNKLDNKGASKNLWYEEYVAHDTAFYLPIISENEDALGKLDKAIDGEVIQFGKNASIGFGLCKIEKIMSREEIKNEQK